MAQRVLIVEDSQTQAQALKDLLTSDGYGVETALSGEEGLLRARAASFDLILSDILMPGINGYELCRTIKGAPEIYGSPRVVLLTGLTDPVYIMKGLESGADNYLTKPYDPNRLLSRIGKILSAETPRLVSTTVGTTIEVLGEQITIEAKGEQILDFLLSSFEDLVDMNLALQNGKRVLQEAVTREKEARKAAEAAIAARDLILATVSHDLRNPLNTILMSASLLLGSGRSDFHPRDLERVRVIERVARQMARLIEDLLDVAAIETGAQTIERSEIDPLKLIHDAAEMFDPITVSKGVRLTTSVPDDLSVTMIEVDQDRILQVISNLLGNAIRFTRRGGEIGLGLEVNDGELVYSVTDEGPGIAAEEIPYIFDQFWRDGETGRGGAGLGLAISKWIVEAHGGRIWVESEVGKGATFRFSLNLPRE